MEALVKSLVVSESAALTSQVSAVFDTNPKLL